MNKLVNKRQKVRDEERQWRYPANFTNQNAVLFILVQKSPCSIQISQGSLRHPWKVRDYHMKGFFFFSAQAAATEISKGFLSQENKK